MLRYASRGTSRSTHACLYSPVFVRRVAVVALVVGRVSLLGGQQAAGAAGQPAPNARPLVLHLDGQERARVRRDVLYKSVDTAQLRADIYLPPVMARPRPPVLLFSGGGSFGTFSNRGAMIYRNYGEIAAAHGLAGVVFDKRSRQGAQGLVDATADIDTLVAFLRQNADSLGIDADRICLWG